MDDRPDERLARLRRDREATRARLIEIEMAIAALVAAEQVDDLPAAIAEAEERGDWLQAARLRATCVADGSNR